MQLLRTINIQTTPSLAYHQTQGIKLALLDFSIEQTNDDNAHKYVILVNKTD